MCLFVLLAQESNPVEQLAGPASRRLQTLLQISILQLEPVKSLRGQPGSAGRRIDSLDSRLGLKRSSPEPRQLIAKVADELLELGKCLFVRPFVV